MSVCIRLVNKDNKIALPWSFIETGHLTSYTYEAILSDIVVGKFPYCKVKETIFRCKNLTVQYGLCSTSHKLLEQVQGPPTTDVIEKSGKFAMLYFTLVVEHREGCLSCKDNEKTVDGGLPNAFQFMMSSSRAQAQENVPQVVKDPKDGVERLHNAILEYFRQVGCVFPKNIGSLGNTFVTKLTNALWYVDGHMTTIERESTRKVPERFHKFKGYNCPEKVKHRKRELGNLSEKKLESQSIGLKEVIQAMKFLESGIWAEIRIDILNLAHTLEDYSCYLRNKTVKIQKIQFTPRSSFEDMTNVTVLPHNKGDVYHELRQLDNILKVADAFEPISMREYLPPDLDRKQIYAVTQNYLLKKGLSCKSVHYVFHSGGSKPSLHFVWKLHAEKLTETELINKTLDVIRGIERNVPVFERRITKRAFQNAYGFVSSKVALRSIFKELTGDKSAAANISEAELDRRLNFALLCEDPGIVVDLRHQASGKERFKVFFAETEKYLSSVVGVACHERRHGEQLYLAKAVSFNDLHKRVKELVPEGTNIPSVKWMRYQFQPIHPLARTAAYYKGNINIKMMVQKRQVCTFYIVFMFHICK